MDVVTRGRAWSAFLIVLVLAVVTGVLLPRSAASAAAAAIPAEGVTVYTDTESFGDGTRTPDIATTSASDSVVAWREGVVPGTVDQGEIRYAYTVDGGTTWSRPMTLAQETSGTAWQYVLLYNRGNEVFAYLGGTAATSTNGNPINTIVVKRSTDGGHTWHEDNPHAFPQLDNIILSGRPVQLADSAYVMPYWSSGRRNGVLFSDDLTTWTDRGHVSNGNAVLAGENQLALAQDDDPSAPVDARHLVMVARSGTTDAAQQATSSDGGATWTDFAPNPDLPSHNIARDFFTKDSDGTYLYIYNSGLDASDRDILDYKIRPAGQSWTAAFFADGSSADWDPTPAGTGRGWDTYPMADEYAPGKYFVVWEFDTSRIRVRTLDISAAAG
ncbi:BNR repeat-like domain-containing protein [Streptomyces sp. DvalAA-14]|uniref:sialidase family protein n=1 Tax=unclassified Streptomyces TaxID=2593676 RepID=UPI00081B005F|nr:MULTISPECIES: sialidase family protein [unclassified Streptomyces]MYS19984.1 hypothetical protein [Streptomyces sp. SID4948]SCD58151.1 BNR repeat-like domain-containing protein [Streptomyces sp. DvalAA-14]